MLIMAEWLLSLKYSKMFSSNFITSYTVARSLGHIWDKFFSNTFEQHLFHSLHSSPSVPIGVWKCFPMPSSPDLGSIIWFTVWALRAVHPEIFVCWSRLCCSQKCVFILRFCRPRGEKEDPYANEVLFENFHFTVVCTSDYGATKNTQIWKVYH